MFDLHITGIIYFFFIGEKREEIPIFFFQVGRYITAVFSVGKENGGGDLRLCRSSSWASRKKKILRNNNNKKKRKKNYVTFSPVSQNDSGRVEKQLNVQTRYIVWIPY